MFEGNSKRQPVDQYFSVPGLASKGSLSGGCTLTSLTVMCVPCGVAKSIVNCGDSSSVFVSCVFKNFGQSNHAVYLANVSPGSQGRSASIHSDTRQRCDSY